MDACRESDEHGHIVHLAVRHEQLRVSHERLRHGIRKHVQVKLVAQAQKSSIVKDFALKSMATVAGWMTAQTVFLFLSLGTDHISDNKLMNDIIAWAIYVAMITVLVP